MPDAVSPAEAAGRLRSPTPARHPSVAAVYEPVQVKLEATQAELARLLRSEHPLIDRLAAGVGVGKLVRPALVLLCAAACGYKGRADIRLAALVELGHIAALVHDDVIDDAARRRGEPTVNATDGNAAAVLLGDFLFLRAIDLLVDERRRSRFGPGTRVKRLVSDTFACMIEGQLQDAAMSGDLDVGEEAYLRMIALKTAASFSMASELGAILARVDRRTEHALGAYGQHLGVAYQILDDIIDLLLDERAAGKPTGSDLRRGRVTLAVIRLLHDGDENDRRLVERVIATGDADALEDVRMRLFERGLVEAARDAAARRAAMAAAELRVLRPSAFRDALERLTVEVVSQAPHPVLD